MESWAQVRLHTKILESLWQKMFWNYVFIFEGIEGKYEIFLTSKSKMNASFSAVTVATIRSIQLGGTSDTVLSL